MDSKPASARRGTGNRERRAMVRGFTLVEILIVVVILGILAVLVIPQFTRASGDAIKSTLRRQIQTVENQVELYRGANSGRFPTGDATQPLAGGGANNGWGALVSSKYLRDPPMNSYTGAHLLVEGGAAEAIAATRDSEEGWFFAQSADRLDFYAAGYDRVTDRLSHEIP